MDLISQILLLISHVCQIVLHRKTLLVDQRVAFSEKQQSPTQWTDLIDAKIVVQGQLILDSYNEC